MAKTDISFKNILVPYDGSSYSNNAFKKALDIAKADGSKIIVFMLIEEVYSTIMGYSGINNKVIKKQQSTAMNYSSKLKSVATNLGVPFTFKIKQGSNPVKEIINCATSYKCDLIVLGSHGRTGWSKLILGSVANGVVQHAKSAVLVVK